ncbi:MFS transporter [Novosphingobium mangrovi (ex Hu et al. 2023)]|uniref:MFS transporter n=1 Tax=Novosphingobium mangrovi (ex Hu et al. 2023) TaxID=2930094 RepID=A0ABT0A8U2_9SPHN|nr:MFS transporter [Novosphingobium mangrovi (ex Hu et al. 2023)]MCJ1959614.1 MFS transporter [Novosphingobium mangrovi (ex Hu et al. 2023)]
MSVVAVMALAAGLTVANLYYNQPMLEQMHGDLADWRVAYVPTATQIGYALGLLFLVPLGDLFERRQLVLWKCFGLAVACAGVALAQGGALVLIASLVVGIFASVAQQIIPMAASLALPERRGHVIGVVMAGLLCGILLSRTLAGFVAEHLGWRAMFWIAVPLALGTAGMVALRLPRSAPETAGTSYRATLGSLVGLWREFPALRRATAIQCCQFGVFSVFWSILAFRLEARFGFGPQVAGLFGILGVVGVLAAPVAGRIADSRGPRRVIAAAACISLASWAIFGLWDGLAGVMLGVIALDFGVQSSQISNQSVIFALKPEARSRINTIYMTAMFVAGGLASAAAMACWTHLGWTGVCTLGAAISLCCVALQFTGGKAASTAQ